MPSPKPDKILKLAAFFLIAGALLFLFLRAFPAEWIAFVGAGLLISTAPPKWQKALTAAIVIIVAIAIVFDPIWKPWLDAVFKVNTVSDPLFSALENGGALVCYLVGLWWGRREGTRRKYRSHV